MSTLQIIAGVGVNLLTPLVGVFAFARFCIIMGDRDVQSPPYLPIFFLFAHLGGWLMVLLTALFWVWSGMASIGVFYLLALSPFVSLGMVLSLRHRRSVSVFHRLAYRLNAAYAVLALA